MVSRTFSRFLDKSSTTKDMTVWYLSQRLKRLERRTRRPNAKQIDYMQRDRVAAQLEEAQKYLG
jgi:hypothetical protein